jgi:hypothetical protein
VVSALDQLAELTLGLTHELDGCVVHRRPA